MRLILVQVVVCLSEKVRAVMLPQALPFPWFVVSRYAGDNFSIRLISLRDNYLMRQSSGLLLLCVRVFGGFLGNRG